MASRFFDYDYMQQWAHVSTLATAARRQNTCQRCSQQRHLATLLT